MNWIIVGKNRYGVPGDWKELTRRELLYICYAQRKYPPQKWPLVVLTFLLKNRLQESLPWYRYPFALWRLQRQLFWADAEIICHWLRVISWINDPKTLPDPRALGTVMLAGKAYHWHDNPIVSATFEEWYYAEMYVQLYRETKEDKYLRSLAMVLYRPGHGQYRMPYDPAIISAWESDWVHATPALLDAIILCWYGVREHYIAKYPRLFKKGKAGNTDPVADPWYDLVRDLADKDLVKTQAYEQMPIGAVLHEANRRLKEADEQRRKMKARP